MKKLAVGVGLPILIVVAALILLVAPAAAKAPHQDSQIERGQYLVSIAGCLDCHTPFDEQGQPDTTKLGAGGYPFDLGPLGIVYTKNLTPDKTTGLGDWTDEEIKTAFTTGVSKDGLHLFPIMPYRFFNHMSDEDVDAVVAYLKTLEPVNNSVERRQILPPEALPQMERNAVMDTPDPADTEAEAAYLFKAVLACEDCHTPLDPNTQAPIPDKYFAGGQPYEGPWGIVYGANITPDKETGIGDWTDADIERAIRGGVRPDGRVMVLMPVASVYSHLSDNDMKAVIYYLRNSVKPVHNEVPAPDLKEGFLRYVPIPTEAPPGLGGGLGLPVIIAVLLVVLVVVGVVYYLIRGRNTPASPAA
jgi:mono/diheme cytochrome c family protein